MNDIKVLELTPIGIQGEVNRETETITSNIYIVLLCKILRNDNVSYVLMRHPWWKKRSEEDFIKDYALQIITVGFLRRSTVERMRESEMAGLLKLKNSNDTPIRFISAIGYEFSRNIDEMVHRFYNGSEVEYEPLSIEAYKETDLVDEEVTTLIPLIIEYKNIHRINKSKIDFMVKKFREMNLHDRLISNKDTGSTNVFLHVSEIVES